MHAGAASLGSLVALKAAALVDLTGLLPAALLAATGLGVLPWQRYRLQHEYAQRVEALKESLDRAVSAHLQAELLSLLTSLISHDLPWPLMISRDLPCR